MNKYDQYPFERITPIGLDYRFTSIGPKGEVKLCVRFESTSAFNTYNLAFGPLKRDNSIDDEIKISNNDRNTILSTVAAIVLEFTTVNQLAYIMINGSTPSRKRLYRMAISLNICYLNQQIDIWGVTKTGKPEPFQVNKNYSWILIRRKL